jgi:acetylornithine deacetylase/succinyl-diaminopimelate desuccinylase-like protein
MPAATPLDKALAHYEAHRDRHIEDLEALVRIPSVSFDGFPPAEVVRSAEAVAELLRGRGLENVRLIKLEGAHPYVYGDWLHAPGKPTLLLYAHHDVQPPGDATLWKSPPFEPTKRADGRIYGRGIADDKAGVVAHVAAIASWLGSAGSIPVNVKVIIEGEEECGSSHLEEFLHANKALLQADVMVLADAGNFDTGLPSLTISLRGLAHVEVEVRSLDHALHSGMWGGPIPDPAAALAKMLATLHDDAGRIAVKGVYDRVRPMSAAERADLERLGVTEKMFREQTQMVAGAKVLGDDNPYATIWRQPALTINAMQASSREQARNIVCDTAWARITVRLVPDQKPKEIQDALVAHLRNAVPWGVQADIKALSAESWWMTEPGGPVFEKARRAFSAGYGKETVFIGCGGSIPFVGPFSEALGGAPALLIGVEDPYTNAHGENESLSLPDFDGAIRSSIRLFHELAG